MAQAARAPAAAPPPEGPPSIDIDGIEGRVPVPPGFFSLPKAEQDAFVDQFVATRRGGQGGPPPPPSGDAAALQGGAAPVAPDQVDESTRGGILPLARTEGGALTLAVPGFLHTPMKALSDVINGQRTIDDLSPEERFGVQALVVGAGGSVARGTGKAITRANQPAPKPAPAESAAAEGAVAAEVAAPAAAPRPAPTAPPITAQTPTAEIKAASQSFYRAADEAGVVIDPRSEGFSQMLGSVVSGARKAGLDKDLTPDSAAVLRRLATDVKAATEGGLEGGLSFQNLEILRRLATDAMGAARPSDRRIAAQIVDKIDDFVAGMSNRDLLAGEAEVAAKTITQARDLWSKVAKLETIERLVQRAQDSVANRPSLGFENALRTEFINLAKNDKLMRTFTEAERDAIRQVTRGPVKRVARGVGTMAPTGPVSFMASGGLTAALGAKLGLDPVGAAVVAGPPVLAVTFGARKLAAVLTQRSIAKLEAIIKTGSSDLASGALTRGRSVLEQLSAAGQSSATAAAATDRR